MVVLNILFSWTGNFYACIAKINKSPPEESPSTITD
jgi:hypothetical protein